MIIFACVSVSLCFSGLRFRMCAELHTAGELLLLWWYIRGGFRIKGLDFMQIARSLCIWQGKGTHLNERTVGVCAYTSLDCILKKQ